MIHAASRASAAELADKVADLIDAPSSAGVDRVALADDIYSVAGLLASQPRLRRTLGDPATDASSRADLARGLLAGKVSELAAQIVGSAVALRWSSPWDLVDVLEISGDEALLAAAEKTGQLDDVEDELFRFERILDGSAGLTSTLDEASVPVARRVGLVENLLAGKANPITTALIKQAVTSGRRTRLQTAIDDLLESSANRRDRSVAKVTSAIELTTAQAERLAAVLSQIYGRDIKVRSAVDPQVRGGLVVRVGHEVIDASVASRMAAARAALAG